MSNSQALLQEGLAAFRARAYDDALRAWRTLLESTPDHPQVKELVARTEALAAEGQLVNQLKEELTDLREELALTRDSRNDLLLEMARLHKRYEEREARLWRMQEAREWELREALASAELKASDDDPHTAALDEEELAAAAGSSLDHHFEPKPKHSREPHEESEALNTAREQVRVLRHELHMSHERIVELEQQLFQYEHDERDLLGQALEDNHALFMDDPGDDERVPFEALQHAHVEATVPPELAAPAETTDEETAREDAPHEDSETSSDADETSDDETSDPDKRPTTQRSASLTGDFRKDIADDARADTGSFIPADNDPVDLPTRADSVTDALVEDLIEETSGIFDLHTGTRSARAPSNDHEAFEPPSDDPLIPGVEDDPFAALKDDEPPTHGDDDDPFAAFKDDEPNDALNDDTAKDDAANESIPPLTFEAVGPEASPSDTGGPQHTAEPQAAPTGDSAPDDIAALPLARGQQDAFDTAEFDLQPIDDKNVGDGFTDELADALSSTPRPPRIETGIQPELPELDFEDDVIEAILPEELERRATWVPVRHKASPVIEDPIAQYLITHIDGVSTFMELRGTVGLPPAAVDSGFRYLLEHDIIRAKPN